MLFCIHVHNMNRKTRIPKPVAPSSGPKATTNPLSKAMEKNPKPDNNKPVQPESWYEEQIESYSQKQHHQTKSDHEKRKEELYAELKETEAELVAMQDLLCEREKLMKEAEEENAEKENGVTGEKGEGDANAGGGQQSENGGKITKKSMKDTRERMQVMREKLQKMNRETDVYLSDIENTMHYLDSLEVASGRLGPLSDETRRLFGDVDDETLIARIQEENHQPGEVDGASDTDELRKDGESPDEDSTQNKSDQSKFFLTEKTAVINSEEIDVNSNDTQEEHD